MVFVIPDPRPVQAPATSLAPTVTLAPVITPTVVSQLPALVAGPAPLREEFLRIDRLDKQLDAAAATAIARVGKDIPLIQRTDSIGEYVAVGAAGGAALLAGSVAVLGFGVEIAHAVLTGMAAAVGGGLGMGSVWSAICRRWQSKAATRSPSAAALQDLRKVVAVETTPVEAAVLRVAATNHLEKLREREVHGFEAQELYGELQTRGAKVTAEEAQRAQRFADVLSALAYHDHKRNYSPFSVLNSAISELQTDEKVQLAPVLLERMFHEEAPIRADLDFEPAYALHARLWDIAHGLPDPEARAKKSRKPEFFRDSDEEAYAQEKRPARAPTPKAPAPAAASTELLSSQQSTLASLDETLKAFEAALSPNLQRQRSVTPASIAEALRIAENTAPTPVALAAIGARARRFLEELDARKLYGYEARQQLKKLAAQEANLSPALRDQIEGIAFYRSAVDRFPPNGLTTDGIELIMRSINNLAACDRKPAAQRAYERFFEANGVPRTSSHTLRYDSSQSFLMRLRAHIREG